MEPTSVWQKVALIVTGSYGAYTHQLLFVVISLVFLALIFWTDSLSTRPGIPKDYSPKEFPNLCQKQEDQLRDYGEPQPGKRQLESLPYILRELGETRLTIISLTSAKLGESPVPVLRETDTVCGSGDDAYWMISPYIEQYRESSAKEEGQSSYDLRVYREDESSIAFCLKLTFELKTHDIKQERRIHISGEGERRIIPISRRPA